MWKEINVKSLSLIMKHNFLVVVEKGCRVFLGSRAFLEVSQFFTGNLRKSLSKLVCIGKGKCALRQK